MASLQTDYPDDWENYSCWWWLFWGSWLGAIPGEVLIGAPLSSFWQSRIPFAVVGIAAMTGFFVGGLGLISWSCPRCGKRFHRRNGYGNLYARRCLNCGLPKRE